MTGTASQQHPQINKTRTDTLAKELVRIAFSSIVDRSQTLPLRVVVFLPQLLQIAAITAATIGTGAATLSVMSEDIPDLNVPQMDWSATGALDGQSFAINGVDLETGATLDGTIAFRDGGFQSSDCEAYCPFGWSDYRTHEADGVVHFTATALCPEAPHTVVWYGTLADGELTLDISWTTRRWYWTNQIRMQATGDAVEAVAASG